MKHIWALFAAVLLGLSGCTPVHTASTNPLPAGASAIFEQEAVVFYPTSFSELSSGTVPVYIDGIRITGQAVGTTVLVSDTTLHSLWDWFSCTPGGSNLSITNADGDSISVPCTPINGVNQTLDDYNGTNAILFEDCRGISHEYWLPIAVIAQQLGYRSLMDTEQNTLYLSQQIDKSQITRSRSVPVLMYHAVSDNCWGISDLFVSPSAMREQLKYLLNNGYDPIFFSDLTHLEDYDKPVLLTFDDGYDDNFTELYPLLQEFQVKATIFIITGSLGQPNYMTAEQARELSQSGLVDIQSHTVNHYELSTLDRAQQTYELQQSQLDIARITGKIPYALSYPRGRRNGTTLELAPQYYDFAVIMNGNRWTIGNSFYEIKRHYVARSLDIPGFASRVR